ncbi:hypothetical protein PTI98_009966 [Pleurotus ostreatus]|nr:hypothetical protein PTI98_009966 [Pleurotus ostreatus]
MYCLQLLSLTAAALETTYPPCPTPLHNWRLGTACKIVFCVFAGVPPLHARQSVDAPTCTTIATFCPFAFRQCAYPDSRKALALSAR